MVPSTASFTGPLFIVGRPRSGTKLLRSMLNEHPRIAIPISETNFIPSLVERFGVLSPLARPERFDAFFYEFSRSVFYQRRAHAGFVLTADELRRSADLNSWASVFEAILRYYAPAAPSSDVIWGDKSPSYLTSIALLRQLYPAARFIHIVRDPRDQALSAKEAWGKHLLRSAEQWRRQTLIAHRQGTALGQDYVEVRFEDLVDKPEAVVTALCQFLDVKYVDGMIRLSVSHENKGSAAGALRVVSRASGRYASRLTERTVRRIDEIVAPAAQEFGYSPDPPAKYRPLPEWQATLYRAHDGAALTRSYVKENGVAFSLRHLLHRSRMPSRTDA